MTIENFENTTSSVGIIGMSHKSKAIDILLNESAFILVWFITTDICCLTHHETNQAELLESKLVMAAPKKSTNH